MNFEMCFTPLLRSKNADIQTFLGVAGIAEGCSVHQKLLKSYRTQSEQALEAVFARFLKHLFLV